MARLRTILVYGILALVVAGVLLSVFLPSLLAPPGRTIQSVPLTQRYPSASDGAGTNCAAADLGNWNDREFAFQDDSPNTPGRAAMAMADPAGAACDDWTGFGTNMDEKVPIVKVEVTVEYMIDSGSASLRVGPWSSGAGTSETPAMECTSQATSVDQGPGAWQKITFDFTNCGPRNWTVQDFNVDAVGVTVEVVPQVQSTVFMDYILVSITQAGQETLPAPTPFVIDPSIRPTITYILGVIAAAAAITVGLLFLLRLRHTKLFKWSVVIAVLFAIAWFLVSYVIR